MTINGLENNYYLSGNDIWLQVFSFASPAIRLELECTNVSTGKSLQALKLYPNPQQIFRFNVSLPIRALQPEPDHSSVPLNTMQLYRIKFTVFMENGSTDIIELERYFIRGGKNKSGAEEWYLISSSPLVVGKWTEWQGVSLPNHANRISGTQIIEYAPSAADIHKMILQGGCDYKIIKFLNSLGGYQFWVFESWEIKKKSKPKKSIGRYTTRLRQNRSKTIGLTSDVSLTLKTKTPIDCQAIINDMIDSPDVLMYDPSGDDTDSRWHRLELDSNDAVLNNADRVYLNEISFNMPNYINRDL